MRSSPTGSSPDDRNLNPSVKFRYLKGGFEIVRDHAQAHEARKVYDYYKDLVTEIKLETLVDGPAGSAPASRSACSSTSATPARSSASRAGSAATFRTRTRATVLLQLTAGRSRIIAISSRTSSSRRSEEHFEVMSVTFQDEKVNSRRPANTAGE